MCSRGTRNCNGVFTMEVDKGALPAVVAYHHLVTKKGVWNTSISECWRSIKAPQYHVFYERLCAMIKMVLTKIVIQLFTPKKLFWGEPWAKAIWNAYILVFLLTVGHPVTSVSLLQFCIPSRVQRAVHKTKYSQRGHIAVAILKLQNFFFLLCCETS